MGVIVATLIDQAKAISNNRRNAAVPDTDWVTFINWAVESWYKFRISLDPGLYFQQQDFALTGGSAGSIYNLDLAFTVRIATAAALPSCIAVGSGVGKSLQALGNGALAVDGVTVVTGDLVLVKNQANSADNGIYIVFAPGGVSSAFNLSRYTGFDQAGPTEIQVGAIVTPTAGNTLANDPCILTSFSGIVDTSAQTWVVNDVAGRFRALHGLDLNPDTAQRQTVRSRNFRQRNDGVGPWLPGPFCTIRKYDLRSNLLVITPYENAAGTYRVYTRAAPYKWATPVDTDPLDAVLEPEIEAIVLLAARSALRIEETAEDPWNNRINEIKAETAAANDRDDGQAFSIADVEDYGGDWY